MNVLENIYRVFDVEIQELSNVRDLVATQLEYIVRLISKCEGKIILCGMGKPGHIGRKISATMSSLGISSFFLHPAEALHGDLGAISPNDIILIISNSGESAEICNILPNLRMIGASIVGITCMKNSTLAKYSDYTVIMPHIKEACVMDLAPTSSTTAELVIGDALAVAASELREFTRENYAVFHPAGALGKKLLTKVGDIMHTGADNAVVMLGSTLTAAINEMTKKGLGAVSIVDMSGVLCGIITDGDLRRGMERKVDFYTSLVDDVMVKDPISVKPSLLAVDALRLMENRKSQISVLPIVDDANVLVGLVRNHDIIRQNIFL